MGGVAVFKREERGVSSENGAREAALAPAQRGRWERGRLARNARSADRPPSNNPKIAEARICRGSQAS